MKRKIIGIWMTVMIMTSLIGCGTETKATNQEITGEETIIVADEGSSEEAIVSTGNEITETKEVIAGEEESNDDASYTEYEFFYVKDNLEKTSVKAMDMNDLKVEGKTYTLNEPVNIYAPTTCILKGYTKPNIDVYVNSYNEEWYCLYFENEESPNNYILVKAEDFVASAGIEVEEKIFITLDDVKKCFMEEIAEWQKDSSVISKMLDSASSDMESTEFKVPMYYSDSDTLQLDSWIAEMQAKYGLPLYDMFFIEPINDEFDEEYLWFRVYYKDSQEEEQ